MEATNYFVDVELPSHKLRIPIKNNDTVADIRKKCATQIPSGHDDYELLDDGFGVKVFPYLPLALYKYTPLMVNLIILH